MYLDYIHQKTTFIDTLSPQQTLQLPAAMVIHLLEQRFNTSLATCIKPHTIPSPVQQEDNSSWINQANIVGINVRTIGSFWNVVKYALTLPASQNSIHLLPIWECGVVNSLYGMASWQLNTEFFSPELHQVYPELNSVATQLAFVLNVLHLMGKTVGMDVIPHTDRFSEMVLAQPHFFEWLQRKDTQIISYGNPLVAAVKAVIWQFLITHKSATHKTLPQNSTLFFDDHFPEKDRLMILFGHPNDKLERHKRRNTLIQMLYEQGFEPVPATMAPPYRGLKIDPAESAKTIDDEGRIWRDFLITHPTTFSRVFNPLARYQFYQNKNNTWEIDFKNPIPQVWQYLSNHYKEIALHYGFDYMRGDMAHVQMRPDGVPNAPDEFYDILGFIKKDIQKEKPFFAYFAESFLAPDDVMGYGNELAHLKAAHADCTLGDLQSTATNDPQFIDRINQYLTFATHQPVKPCLTMMTADKDDPRFDAFYHSGNEIRLFLGLFLSHMPSYMALGFETRDPHYLPAPNEFYTKYYVFQETKQEKATQTVYQWGKNIALLQKLNQIRKMADQILPHIYKKQPKFLTTPSPQNPNLIWTYPQTDWVFQVDLKNNTYSITPSLS